MDLCRAYITMDNVLFVASITSLFVLTIDRYIGLQYSFGFTYKKMMSKRFVRFVIAGIWSYASAWGVAVNLGMAHFGASIAISNTLQCVCANRYYVTTVFIVVFYLPVFVMCFLYKKIFQIAQRHAKEIAKHTPKRLPAKNPQKCSLDELSILSCMKPGLSIVRFHAIPHEEELTTLSSSDTNIPIHLGRRRKQSAFKSAIRSAKMSKTTRIIAIVCGCFIVCWLPVSILSIGLVWSKETFSKIRAPVHVVIVDILPVLNSTINPCIYSLVNSTYRKAFRKVFQHSKNKIMGYFWRKFLTIRLRGQRV